MDNQAVAAKFDELADLLAIQGESSFRVNAYRRAAETIRGLGRDLKEIAQAGELQEIPGVGQAIAEKIEQLLSSGKMQALERARKEVPPSLLELLQVAGVGPKRAALFWKELRITDLRGLEKAARAGKLRAVRGLGPAVEKNILAGIEALARRTDRLPIGTAWPLAQELLERLRQQRAVRAAEPAGSLRRRKETVGDLDLLAASSDPKEVLALFTQDPLVTHVIARGQTKASVELKGGIRAQLWVHPPERFGTALQYATGSKEHNVRLRERALSLGLSLSEHALTRKNGKEMLCASEAEVYERLKLPWIAPELREDRGEMEAALAGKLPSLLELSQMTADLHTHSTWSDGHASILEMAQSARDLGLKVLAITDHSQSLGVANGLSPTRLREQRKEIQSVQRKLGDSILLLQGSEVEVRADGALDYPDEVLAELDLVIAAVHTSLRQEREHITARMLRAIRNPYVHLVAHPSGRLIPDREPADLDMEAILKEAAERKVTMEIDANPARLDLNDAHARRAAELGCLLAINTDAHSPQEFALREYGVGVARRAWLTRKEVVTAWKPMKIRNWLKRRQPKGR
ncbi:MAG: DNA polymerase/3'-5' exonuclease PolX [Anaerolineales bacterium]|jgi:DNA polymerase (family 10)